jgi:uncharacterized membrane protein YhaH (DUF805 family)
MNIYRENGNLKVYNTENMNVLELFILMWKRYFDFEGLSTRREYWLTYLVFVSIAVVFNYLSDTLFTAFIVAGLIPQLSLVVRRLHDTGVSGWRYLWVFTGFGGFYVIYLLARESR